MLYSSITLDCIIISCCYIITIKKTDSSCHFLPPPNASIFLPEIRQISSSDLVNMLLIIIILNLIAMHHLDHQQRRKNLKKLKKIVINQVQVYIKLLALLANHLLQNIKMKNASLQKSMIREVVNFDHNQKDLKIIQKVLQDLDNVHLLTSLDYNIQQKSSHMKPRSRSLSQQSRNMKDKILSLNKQMYKSRQPTLFSDIDAKQQQLEKVVKKNYSSFQKSKGIVKWQLNKQQRFTPIIQQQLNENDRCQIIDKIKHKKKKTQKISNSAVFASQTVKSHFQSLIYQTNNQYKLEVKKIIGCKNTSPAPGSYEISKSMGKKPNRFYPYQFFGSTVARFPEQEIITEENQNNDTPGPGYYMKQQSKTAIRDKRIKTQQTNDSFQQRVCSYVDLQKNVPGPGSYNVQHSSFKTKKSNDCFGSYQPRFSLQKPSQQPKKVQLYALTTKQNRMSGKTNKYPFNKQAPQNKISCYFKSNIDRDCFQDQRQRKNIPFGQYDVSLNDISSKMKKYNQLTQQLSNCHLSRPPFLSSMERFKEDEIQEENVHGNCWCLAKSIQKQFYQPVSSFFKSQSKRIQTFDQKAKSPPVGSYNQNSSLIKGSFNSKFFKNSLNQGKKIACWKPSQ